MTAHLLACTVAALVAVIAARMLRGQRAAWRHTILFLALLRFTVPTAWITDAGRALVRVAPARPRVQRAAEDLGWLLRGPGRSGAATTAPGRPGGLRYEGLWAVGVVVCLGLWGRRALRRIPAVRVASELENEVLQRAAGTLGVELRIVAADVVPGAWGLWRRCVILPDGLSEQLTEAELEAVLAHEVAHVRRRDNLLAAIAHAIVAVFWFHPVVWWIERRMLAERETACDELVLAHGAQAQDYVAGILKVCRMSFAGAAGYAGVTGSNLKDRMEFIMSVDLNRRSSRVARALLGMLFASVVLLPMAGGYLKAQQKPPAAMPGAADAKFRDGVDLVKDKKYAEAEQAFRELQQLDPANTRGLMGQVEVKILQGQWDEALQMLQAEVDGNPARVDLRLALGNTAVRAGRYDQAIAVFQGIVGELDKGSKALGDLYLRLGETYRRKGDIESAIAALRRALAILPDNIVVKSTLALVLDAAGHKADAGREYRAILERNPNNAVAMNNLAYLISATGGDLDEALTLAQRARQILPDLDEVSDTLGWIYLKKDMPDPAIELFDKLVQTKPARSTYHYHLALALSAKGDKFAAAEQLKAALTCNPGADEAEKIRQMQETIRQ